MNRQEIGQLLTVAAGFDNRKVDRVTVEAWAMIPDIAQGRYDDALAAVVAHQTGPKRHEYLTVSHIVDAMRAGERQSEYQIEADVRSAKARNMIPAAYPPRQPLPNDVRHALATIRELENRQAQTLAVDFLEPATPIDVGDVGKRP